MKKTIFILLFPLTLLIGCSDSFNNFKAYQGIPAATIFHRAEKRLAEGKYDKAVKDLEALDAIYPFGPYAQQGQLDIIYAYYMNDDDGAAIAAADRYMRLYPRSNNVDYAYYMKGLIQFNQGQTWAQRQLSLDPSPRDLTSKKQAFLTFDELAQYFPSSIYRDDALLRMAILRNFFAHKELLLAEYYFDRHAYVAAANRASGIVKHYNGTPYVEEALVLMVRSYRKLELPQMANNSLVILKATYPDSKMLTKLERSASYVNG